MQKICCRDLKEMGLEANERLRDESGTLVPIVQMGFEGLRPVDNL